MSLKDASGVRIPLANGSLLIGRSPSCHVVLSDPHVSRRHVLVLELDGAAQIVPLGKGKIELAGKALDEPAMAANGDRLVCGEATFMVEVPPSADAPGWVLEVGSHVYPVRGHGFRLGGGEANDLRLPGWPSTGATLYPVHGGLLAELGAEVEVQGAEMDVGSDDLPDSGLVRLRSGSKLSAAGLTVRVALSQSVPATIDLNPAPSQATLELMPNGALLRVMLDRLFLVWLPQKRGDLVAALLSPPTGVKPGDWVPDELLLPRVWGNESASKAQLNTLIHRTRLSLTGAGLNGPSLLERAPGGGATRVRLAKNAVVSVS